jgi:hypothetical protein
MANRRELLIGMRATLLAAGMGGLARAAPPGSWVLYVSAADCRICRTWEYDHKDAFAQGLQRHGIGFRQLAVSSLRDVRAENEWPADLRWIRDANPNMKGTPWFFVVSGGTIQSVAYGTDMWRTKLAAMAA